MEQNSSLRAQGLQLRAQGTRRNSHGSGFLTTHAMQIVHHAPNATLFPGTENAIRFVTKFPMIGQDALLAATSSHYSDSWSRHERRKARVR